MKLLKNKIPVIEITVKPELKWKLCYFQMHYKS